MDSKPTQLRRFAEGTSAASLSVPASPQAPAQPPAPFFDSADSAWVMSRYADVLAALREPALRPAGPQKAPAHVREDVLDTLSQSKLAEWQEQIEPLADRIAAELPTGCPVDLVSEVLRPWSLSIATIMLGFDAATCRQLIALQPRLSAGNADAPLPRRSLHRVRLAVQRRMANARLERLLRGARVPGAKSLFIGLSQTVPFFLANAWLALIENPAQLARLCAEPHLLPRATEELLRYCGTVHTLVRKAERTVELAGVTIAKDQKVLLKVAAANRDPEQFPDPDSLDITRRGGHIALGTGPHSCVGAVAVRMAAISVLRAFAGKLAQAELIEPVVWRRGSVHGSPFALRVRFGRMENSERVEITPSSS
jgi:cytochrome P450